MEESIHSRRTFTVSLYKVQNQKTFILCVSFLPYTLREINAFNRDVGHCTKICVGIDTVALKKVVYCRLVSLFKKSLNPTRLDG